jgi:hypothetical protein
LAPVRLIRAALPGMVERGSGTIISELLRPLGRKLEEGHVVRERGVVDEDPERALGGDCVDRSHALFGREISGQHLHRHLVS